MQPGEPRSATASHALTHDHGHASRRLQPAGGGGHAPCRDCRRDLAAAGQGGPGGGGRRPLVDLSFPLDPDARVRIVTDKSPEALPLCPPQHGAPAGRRGDGALPRRRSAASGRRSTKASSTTSSSRGRSCPRTSRRSRTKMRELAQQDCVYERQMWPRDEAWRFSPRAASRSRCSSSRRRRPARPKSPLHDQGPRHLRRLLRRPARAVDRPAQGVQAADDLERLLEGRRARTSRCSAIYGTAFLSEKELDAHLTRIEEAKKRDHRKVGKELGLFMFHPWAPGATFWLAKGTTLYNTLADYMRGVLFPAGYVEVKTPIIFNKALWETSGHWAHYRENMFLVEVDETASRWASRPMNCPGHMLVFASEMRSYRDLPLRLHEQTPLHRNEASGVLSGLTRVRQFSQDDAHCFVMRGADRARKSKRCCGWCSGSTATSASSTRSSCRRVPRSSSARSRPGTPPRRRCSQALEQPAQAYTLERGRRRVLRPEDRLRHHRRARPEVAVRHDPARLPDAGSGST